MPNICVTSRDVTHRLLHRTTKKHDKEFVIIPESSAANALLQNGYALLQPQHLQSELTLPLSALASLQPSWNALPRDAHLRDGGRYRFRRHGCFVHDLHAGVLDGVAHRAHWQPVDYNALHGGLERWFDPIDPAVVRTSSWVQLITGLGTLFANAAAASRPVARWYVEAHQFRIDTDEGIGRPTPEGAHRDGVDYVAVILVNRRNVRGGETRVFEAHGIAGVRFTMHEPWTTLLLDDARVIHETTPIQPEHPPAALEHDADLQGVRDTLVLTYREHGFQSPQDA